MNKQAILIDKVQPGKGLREGRAAVSKDVFPGSLFQAGYFPGEIAARDLSGSPCGLLQRL